ncbi:PspC domain-containing protein [bacterium]|nr:PspC domain-containing protein [bacterium]MBU1983720.1 PspC domain-containing protein [bacterium]
MALGLSFLPFFWRTPDWRIAGPIVIIALGVGLLLWRRDRDAKKSSRQTDSGGKDSAADPSGAFAGERTARRLVRRHRGRKIAGVCEGFGHYFGIDPTIVRVIWLALALVGGAGLLLYLILWIAMPLEE